MDRDFLFEEFINECEKKPLKFCGQGNPNADILVIGKEPNIRELNTDKEEIKRRLQENEDNIRRGVWGTAPRDPKNPTWCNYQLLIEKIYGPQGEFNPKLFDFEKYAFTTELNTIFRPKAVLDAETKKNINEHLLLFKDSKFIQDFPVIILACSNYIRNDDKNREIDNTFHVEFCQEYGSKESKNRFWTHIDKNDPRKLVIHTRQFSLIYMKDEDKKWLIQEMAKVIRDHLRKLRLI